VVVHWSSPVAMELALEILSVSDSDGAMAWSDAGGVCGYKRVHVIHEAEEITLATRGFARLSP